MPPPQQKQIYHSIQQNITIGPNGQPQGQVTYVEIQNGKGVKGVMKLRPNGKQTRRVSKLTKAQVRDITRNIFVPRLFGKGLTRRHKQRDA